MVGRRASARQAATGNSSSPPAKSKSPPSSAGTKRKVSIGAESQSKKGKKSSGKEQSIIEDTLNPKGTIGIIEEMGNGQSEIEADKSAYNKTESAESKVEESNPDGLAKLMDQNSKKQADEDKNVTAEGTGSKVSAAENAVEISPEREAAIPSSILEKGIIYFFFRSRVGVTEPTNIADIARSYIVLRPLPGGAKLGDGPIGDEKNNRLLALPKKVLPKSPKDRFMVFVEKGNASMDEIKESLSSSDYSTKTMGARHAPAATPIGGGVYAITQTGRETHLAYILTIPAELDEVQTGVGLTQRGSYFTSAKNPQSGGPAGASLPQAAEYPQEIIDEFHGRAWMPLQPKMLEYANAQFLIIGHGDDALEKAARPQDGEDEKTKVETPLQEVEKLEHEDELRVQHLDGDDSVFTDLGLSSREYSRVQTTW